MSEHPYTDNDLRAEAARQHAKFTTEPDEGLVGEVMESGNVLSLGEGDDARTWLELLEPEGEGTPEYAEAQRAVTDLIRGAADTSAWAVNLGADGLEPSTEHEITLNAGRPIARIHFAFEPGMPEEMRTDLVEGIGDAINEAGVDREDDADADEKPADSDSDVFDLISEIAARLRDATDSGEYQAVGLIYDLAMSRTTVAEARAELAAVEFRHV